MFWFKKKKQNEVKVVETKPTPVPFKSLGIDDFTCELNNQDEKDLVSCIATAIMAQDKHNSKFKIKSISQIDTEKEIAVGLVAAILAQDKPTSQFRCHRVTEINTPKGERAC